MQILGTGFPMAGGDERKSHLSFSASGAKPVQEPTGLALLA